MMQVKSGRKFNIGGIGARISDLAMTFPNSAAVAIEAFGQQEAKRYKSRNILRRNEAIPQKPRRTKRRPPAIVLKTADFLKAANFFKSRKFLRERKAPRP